ncbi:MAG: hypothetical protein E7630_03880 [Ruminococcaceae bacterium]|nr:hypothetical protein [Oscillospiraceae bacterium]
MSYTHSLSPSRLREYVTMYAIGSVLYALIEILFRGYTHFTMVITGGICGILLHRIRRLRSKSLLLRAFLGCLAITGVELSVGILVNRVWNLKVWDYGYQPLNLLGQICPLFSFYWFLLTFPAFSVSDLVSRHLSPCLYGGFCFDLFPFLSERIRYGIFQKTR